MNVAYQFRGGTKLAITNDDVVFICFALKEACKIYDIIAVRYKAPSIWWNGCIEVITKRTMETKRRCNDKKPIPYSFSFLSNQAEAAARFFQQFLDEIRYYKGVEGTLVDGWWTWPEEDAHAPEPMGQPAAQPEAAAPTPAAPPVDAQPAQPAAAAGPDLEQVIRDKVAGEKKQAGPACPDCGCTSIFADKDETGAVVITCLNCGRKWHPGEHRSW